MATADRENVHRWVRGATTGASANRYHPFNPRGLYAQGYLRERFVRLIVENGIPLDRMDILDLGCGTGTWCRYFAELKGATDGIVGVDVSSERLALARSLSPIEYVEGDMTSLPELLGRRFDFVSAFVSLMFLEDRSELRTVLSNVHSVLRPGGYLFVYEQDEDHDPAADFSGWPRSELIDEATSVGFEIVAQDRLFKMLLGVLHPLEGMSFARMSWYRAAEFVIPGRWLYSAVLLQRSDAPGGTRVSADNTTAEDIT